MTQNEFVRLNGVTQLKFTCMCLTFFIAKAKMENLLVIYFDVIIYMCVTANLPQFVTQNKVYPFFFYNCV